MDYKSLTILYHVFGQADARNHGYGLRLGNSREHAWMMRTDYRFPGIVVNDSNSLQ